MSDYPGPLVIAGIAGSLRRGSYNRGLLRSAQELAPPTMRIEIQEIAGIPFFNEDVEKAGIPDAVVRLRAAVAAADGLLIATPEYNYGVPGVLKNTIDWLSRPPHRSVLNEKPAAIMGASQGAVGTARSQSQLRQAFAFTNTPAMLQPEMLVAQAHGKFDAEGHLTDQVTRDHLLRFLNKFFAWITSFNAEARRSVGPAELSSP